MCGRFGPTPPLLRCPYCRRDVPVLERLDPVPGGVAREPHLVCPACAAAVCGRQFLASPLARY